ncbi:MAG: hypothetical protein KKD44_19385 [Proteobacteria bacterium]|nr:hypothetical protein [Pseudomonadota bacterium]
MESILLIGGVFNLIGGIGILLSIFIRIPFGYPGIPPAGDIVPRDYMQFRFFCVGTAFSFGTMYLYLYRHPQHAIPFLFFGMGLKYWAFASSLIAKIRYNMPNDAFLLFGVSNLLVGVLFTIYLLAV